MTKCKHRECDLQATHHVISVYMETDVCDIHHLVLDNAQRYDGGYSAANTDDNIFGWTYIEGWKREERG